MAETMNIYCVYTPGGDFEPWHVNMLNTYVSVYGHKLVCYTNAPEGIICETRDAPGTGWWDKIYLFTQPAPFLYLDLDVLVLADPKWFGGMFAGPTAADDAWLPGVNTSIMWVPKSMPEVWERWNQDARPYWSDQPFLNQEIEWNPVGTDYGVYSYKAHCKEGVPHDARFVFFHGKPRPWELRN